MKLIPRWRNLRNIGDGRGHHKGHGQSFECLEGEDISGVRDEGVTQHPGSVGQHADDDDVHVADDVGDGSGKDLKETTMQIVRIPGSFIFKMHCLFFI